MTPCVNPCRENLIGLCPQINYCTWFDTRSPMLICSFNLLISFEKLPLLLDIVLSGSAFAINCAQSLFDFQRDPWLYFAANGNMVHSLCKLCLALEIIMFPFAFKFLGRPDFIKRPLLIFIQVGSAFLFIGWRSDCGFVSDLMSASLLNIFSLIL